MAILDEAFDTPNEEGTSPIKLLPPGNYSAEIMQAETGPTKNGKGVQIKLQWTITQGAHEKRCLFQYILVKHESEDAMRFGRQKLKDVCSACGITEKLTDTDQLLFKACTIRVKIVVDKNGQYPEKNEIASVKPFVNQAPLPPIDKDLNDKIPF